MTGRCPELVASGRSYAQCHRPAGHPEPHHAAGRSWYAAGDLGQRLRLGVLHFGDCAPVPEPPKRPGRKRRPGTRRSAR